MFFSNVTNNNFKTAIYIRLSRDDGDKQESESIGNQRDIIKRYIKENGLQFVDEYVDDIDWNESGTVGVRRNRDIYDDDYVVTSDYRYDAKSDRWVGDEYPDY